MYDPIWPLLDSIWPACVALMTDSSAVKEIKPAVVFAPAVMYECRVPAIDRVMSFISFSKSQRRLVPHHH